MKDSSPIYQNRQATLAFYKTWLIYFVYFVIATSLMASDILGVSFVRSFKKHYVTTLLPVVAAVNEPVHKAINFFENFHEIVLLRQENQRLRQNNEILKQQLLFARNLKAENESLRTLLDFQTKYPFEGVTARIMAESSTQFAKNYIIDAGHQQDIHMGQPVICSQGLVGRIVEVGKNYSRVQLITDGLSRIPVILEQQRLRAILEGNYTLRPQLTYLPEHVQIVPGEKIVTSGDGGGIPPGIPVGFVSGIVGQNILVQPFVDQQSIEYVRVLTLNQREVLKEAF